MKIERISLEDLSVSPCSGAHVATVLLHGDITSLSIRASALPAARFGNSPQSDLITRALVQDAIRQVRRMPEYRAGTQVITIADSAWPTPAQQA